ncbi:cytidine deaminase [Pelagibius sp. Alg239-R121]|uniref:cytidine deaminase n=1 Tax=Pelagibius sp. Alg239-R121 TaxID=2993448 RepID=UPI002AC3490A|nr:cytidine deaminase [Pelagibius sp. Alg239-R121]
MTEDLIAAARDAMSRAYAPYSGFAVGAAVRADNGEIYSGCNVENAAYPEGLCAEASAIAAMVNAGVRRLSEVCVMGKGDALVTPCGGCRQKIREFAAGATAIHVCGPEGLRKTTTLDELLPLSFGPENLK